MRTLFFNIVAWYKLFRLSTMSQHMFSVVAMRNFSMGWIHWCVFNAFYSPIMHFLNLICMFFLLYWLLLVYCIWFIYEKQNKILSNSIGKPAINLVIFASPIFVVQYTFFQRRFFQIRLKFRAGCKKSRWGWFIKNETCIRPAAVNRRRIP